MSTAAGLSLFPSATETADGQGGPKTLPPLTTRQSMLDFKRSSWLSKQVKSPDSDIQTTSGSTLHGSPADARRNSMSGKSQASVTALSSRTGPSESTSPQSFSPERPYSPNSFQTPSARSSSPTLVTSNRTSVSTLKTRKKAPPSSINTNGPSQIRSIFPTYDTDLPLDQQWYLPTQTSPRNIPWEQVCKAPYSPDFEPPYAKPVEAEPAQKPLLFTAPQNTLSNFTPEIELPSLWELSQGRANSEARSQTYHLQMHRHQPSAKKPKQSKGKPVQLEPMLTFGPSTSIPFFSVFSEQCIQEKEKSADKPAERVRIRKHNLARFDSNRNHYGESSILVSDMTMNVAGEESSSKEAQDASTTVAAGIADITPHKAILDSLSMAGTSSAAAELAVMDPGASSLAAAHLAEVAMNKAKKKHTSNLSFSIVPALRQRGYALQHPSLGYFQIQIEGDVRLENFTASDAVEKAGDKTAPIQKPGSIKLLAPMSEKVPPMYGISTSSQHAFKNQSTVLASIDLPSSTLTLNGTALTSLNDRYMVDTAVSTLVTVLLAETACPRLSHLTSFAPPPTGPLSKGPTKRAARYKYLPLIKTRKEPKMSGTEKAAMEAEQSMTVAVSALVFVLEAAVDGLHSMSERARANNST